MILNVVKKDNFILTIMFFVCELQYAIMILSRDNRQDKINKIDLSQYLHPPSARPPHNQTRNIFTSKTKSRKSVTSMLAKTISTRMDSPSLIDLQQVSSYQLPNTKQLMEMQHSRNQFDRLQLQDFLKVAIVGDQKITENKSREIIRSINGTWFKNTNVDERPGSRLYNNLGIRKSNISVTCKKLEELDMGQHQLFTRHYTPPNFFPPRKLSLKNSPQSKKKILFQKFQTKNRTIQQNQVNIKTNILSKMFKKQQKPKSANQRIRKATSLFANRESAVKWLDFGDAGIQGKQMIIHQ